MGIQVFHHCFKPIFHLVHEVFKAIIHSMKYHFRVHGFIDSGQTDGLNVWCNSLNKQCCVVAQFDACTFSTLNNDFSHYFMKWTKVWSMGVDEPSSTSTLSQQPSSSMVASPPMLTMPTGSTRSWLQFSSSNAPSSNYKYVGSLNMDFKPLWWIPK